MLTSIADVLAYANENLAAKTATKQTDLGLHTVLQTEKGKPFAILAEVLREDLGIRQEGTVRILDVLCHEDLIGSLLMGDGFMPSAQMKKPQWITVVLDGTVPDTMVTGLVEESFALTGAPKPAKKQPQPQGPREWIIPANPAYYNIEAAFAAADTILWKQSSNIRVGDIVYMYVAAPRSAILYKCRAVEVDIPSDYKGKYVRMRRAMQIRLLHRFDPEELTFAKLKEFGVYAIRGPRGVPNGLHWELERLCKEKV